jgi:hypothetical protein
MPNKQTNNKKEYDCRPENFNELSEATKELYKSMDELQGKNIMVVCEIEGLTGIAIKTTHKYIADGLKDFEKMNKEKKQFIFCSMLSNILKYRGKIDKIYNKGRVWQNLCDDIVLYYCARVVMFNKPIPLKVY